MITHQHLLKVSQNYGREENVKTEDFVCVSFLVVKFTATPGNPCALWLLMNGHQVGPHKVWPPASTWNPQGRRHKVQSMGMRHGATGLCPHNIAVVCAELDLAAATGARMSDQRP